MPKYCLPITVSSPDEILVQIRANLKNFDYFEVWLDYVEQAGEAFTQKLLSILNEKLIIVFRRQKLEDMRMTLVQRLAVIEQLQNSGALVDLDITTQTEEFENIKQNNWSVNAIASYHNYQETPTDVQLKSIIDKMKPYQPAIYKLASQCNTERDSLRLLNLLLDLKSDGTRAIVLGMGEMGIATRIFGSLWGNEMAFTPLSIETASAPGQLTKDQLESFFKEIHGRQ